MARRLGGALPVYARIAWLGLVESRLRGDRPPVVQQGAVFSECGVLLSVRGDLRGWELPGGNMEPGESDQAALARELREETGLEVVVERHIGDYVRSGFRPHTARVFRCRAVSGTLRPSPETPCVRWFPLDRIPDTLLPWYRAPLADALANLAEPVERHERQGVGSILSSMVIDLRMRLRAAEADSDPYT